MLTAQKLPEVLLDKSIEYHTRRGLRDCDCEYCTVKSAGTYEIAHIGQMRKWSGYSPMTLDSWEVWASLQKERRNSAERLREKLTELKLEL